jgi:hypothetical protein
MEPVREQIGPATPIEAVASVTTEPASKRKLFWSAAAILFGLMLAGTFFLLRRPRHSAEASLITRSLDRDRR